ncbi:zinc transport system substrate-binding protein [Allonocardiopsis opalescens]|uniref:Zinc transport system substrate-binding protein n=2 Tax=Allonocardiopsis opalescens TaxID=1144618 RepID=A0A2T0Q9M4_9ACTN|nr:zinc transport system substrate-binding protein [Allonocardiopsis opalescens]
MARNAFALVGAGALLLAGAACGTGADGSADDGRPTVVTAVYPLQWLAERVAGDRAEVANLVEPGVEAHDVELTPRQVGELGQAAVVFYIAGMSPAVDDAVAQEAPDTALDAQTLTDPLAPAEEEGGEHADEHAEEEGHTHEGEEPAHEEGHTDEAEHAHEGEAEHAHEGEAEHAHEGEGEAGHDHAHEGADPHLWLDPTRMGPLAEGLAERLSEADPEGAETYAANAQAVADETTALDEEFTTALEGCAADTIVTSHTAFGYLADRYGLHQVGIAGLSPDTEPSPARMAEVAEIAEHEGVSTVFTETTVSPEVAQTLADEIGVSTAVLNTLEGGPTEGGDYLSTMRENLAALTGALDCG